MSKRKISLQSVVARAQWLLLGLLLGHLSQHSFRLFPSLESPPSEAVLDASSQQQQGWKPVHVFTGNSSLLEGDDRVSFSQDLQDVHVMMLLENRTTGYFIDLAANDAVNLSNTLALERSGWEGICIEPNPEYWYRLAHRKCHVVGSVVGSKVEEVSVKFSGGVTGGIKAFVSRTRGGVGMIEKRYTAPLQDIFHLFNVPSVIDYLSLDCEGSEYLVMSAFPFQKYTIRLLSIERPQKQLLYLLKEHGYVFLYHVAGYGETMWSHKSTGLTSTHPRVREVQTHRTVTWDPNARDYDTFYWITENTIPVASYS